MNAGQIQTVTHNGVSKLLYTHDDSFTRHAVELYGSRYVCTINEVACFTRGTHERMLDLAGFNRVSMKGLVHRPA